MHIMTLGYLAIFTTLLIWSGFFLSLKGGAISALQPADIALTRFLIPALVLSPLVLRAKNQIVQIPKRYLAGMFIGSGLPYLLMAGTAMHYVPVAHGSTLVPGTLPLFVTGIAVLFYQQPLSRHRIFGLSLVVVGIGLFLAPHLNGLHLGQETKGHLLLLLCSLMWASFTISARVANLNALVSSGFVALLSLIALVLAMYSGLLPSYLAQAPLAEWPWRELLGHTFIQGIGAGLIASVTYLYAVRTLGAERSAAFGSATPVLATLLAIPAFGEYPDSITWLALIVVSSGSLIASNIFMRHDTSLDYQPPAHGVEKR